MGTRSAVLWRVERFEHPPPLGASVLADGAEPQLRIRGVEVVPRAVRAVTPYVPEERDEPPGVGMVVGDAEGGGGGADVIVIVIAIAAAGRRRSDRRRRAAAAAVVGASPSSVAASTDDALVGEGDAFLPRDTLPAPRHASVGLRVRSAYYEFRFVHRHHRPVVVAVVVVVVAQSTPSSSTSFQRFVPRRRHRRRPAVDVDGRGRLHSRRRRRRSPFEEER